MKKLRKLVLTLCIFALTIVSIPVTSTINVQASQDTSTLILVKGKASSALVGKGTNFKSNYTNIVKVSSTGKLTAIACGEAKVTWNYKKYGRTYTDSCSILVKGKDTSTIKYGLDGNVYVLSPKNAKIADRKYSITYMNGSKKVYKGSTVVYNDGETKLWIKIPGTNKSYTKIVKNIASKNTNRKPNDSSKVKVEKARYMGDGQISFTINASAIKNVSKIEPEVTYNAMLVDTTTGYVVGSIYDSVIMRSKKQIISIPIHCDNVFQKLNADHKYDVIVTALVTDYCSLTD